MLYLLFVIFSLLLWLIVFLVDMDNQDERGTPTSSPGAFSLTFQRQSLPFF